MDLVNTKVGSEGLLTIKVSEGKVLLSVGHEHASGKITVTAEEDGGYFLDKLAAAIPGELDDAVIAVLKAALLKL